MGKYSDIDIDEMLKRIQENVNLQSSAAEDEEEPAKEPERTEINASTPDELINLIMADIGSKGKSSKDSSDSDMYDISGFEIEEQEEEPEVEEPVTEDENSEETDFDETVEDVEEIEKVENLEQSEEIEPVVSEQIQEDENLNIEENEDVIEEVTEEVAEGSIEEAVETPIEDIQESVAEEVIEEAFEEIIEEVHEETIVENTAEEDRAEDSLCEESEELETLEEAEKTEELEELEELEPLDELYDTAVMHEISVTEAESEVEEAGDSAEAVSYGDEPVTSSSRILWVEDPDEYDVTEDNDNVSDFFEELFVKNDITKNKDSRQNGAFGSEIPATDGLVTAENNENAVAADSGEEDFSSMSKVTYAFSKFQSADTRPAEYNGEFSEEYSELDNYDINLALSLGNKDSLESTYGYVKISEARHNFVNTERKSSGSNVILDVKGKEYRNLDQGIAIREEYRRAKKRIGKRIFFTALIFIFITLCELMPASKEISELIPAQFRNNFVSFLLFSMAVIFSAKKLFNGVVGFFTTRSNYYTVLGFVSFVNILYNLLTLTVFRNDEMQLMNSVVVFGILITTVGEYMQLIREIHTFELASDGKKKISLEKIDISPETIKKPSFIDSNEFVLETTNFVGRYFERSARTPEVYHLRHTFVTLTMLLSLFVAVAGVIVTRDFSYFVFTIELASIICVPVQIVFLGSYAFYIISKKLLKLDSAIIGETFTDEYVGSNTIYLDDVEVFGRHGVHVVNLESFNNFNIIDINYYYLSVFSKVSGPLKNAFGDIPDSLKLSDRVELVNLYSNGLEAVVDGKNTVLVGKSEFIRSKGITVANQAEDKFGEKGDISIMYIAVNNALCAKLYLKYSVSNHFEKFAESMAENGSCVGVRTIDPNITEEMIARLRVDKINAIKVIRPTINDLTPIGRRSDSGIITEKNPHMVARILAEGLKIKNMNDTMNIIWAIYSVLGIATVITLLFFGVFRHVQSIYVVIYQILWMIGLAVYVKNKLRNGKTK